MLAEMERTPGKEPGAEGAWVGRKLMLTVQEALATSVAVQVLVPREKPLARPWALMERVRAVRAVRVP